MHLLASRWIWILGLSALMSACGGGSSSGVDAVAAPGGNVAPAANFSFALTPANAKAPVTVQFDGGLSRDADGQIAQFAWNFGDGNTGTGQSPQNVYTLAGRFDVTLTVTDDRGATNSFTRSLTINPTNVPAAVRFTPTPVRGSVPLTVNFDASASIDSDGTITAFAWDFGDGATDSSAVVDHTFTQIGTYQVSLTLTDSDNATSVSTAQITVDPALTLSGTINILGSSAVDGDINDVTNTNVSNNSFDTAQPLNNPVTLGGYVNQPDEGIEGQTRTNGDISDFYRLELSGNESLILTIGAENPAADDVDLFLYDANRTQIDSSELTGSTEIIVVNQPGTYFVEVLAFSGGSTYNLSIGLQANSLPQERLSSASEFVVGELLITPRSQNSEIRTLLQQSAGVEISNDQANSGPMLVKLKDLAVVNAQLGLAVDPRRGIHAASTNEDTERRDTIRAVKLMRKRKDVAAADLNYIRRAFATPNDGFFNLQWHLRDIALPQAWDVTTGSGNVTVAVIDTGVLRNHPDLNCDNRTEIDGYDFIADTERANDGNGRDADANDPGDENFGGQGSFHGTHVAGTVGACTNNALGVAGTAWNVRLMPLRVLGVGGGTSNDLIAAIRYAAGLANAANVLPSRRADIINMSLGGGGFSNEELTAITDARNAGVIVIAAAGNDASATPAFPASYQGVVSVSATTISRSRAPYSNFGTSVDVAAPGGNNATDLNGDGKPDGVLSTRGDDSGGSVRFVFDLLNGTSMAAPHVAGVAALMKSVHSALTPQQFDTELLAGTLTDDIGIPGRDDSFGHGIINANKAVLRAQNLANGSGGNNAFLFSTPSALSFGVVTTPSASQTINLQNAGSGAASITSVSSDQPWLTVSAPPANGGLGAYTITATRGALADGSYSGTLRFNGTPNNVDVQVLVQFGSFSTGANAGPHYVLAVDPATNQTLFQSRVTVDGGEYRYSIPSVFANTPYIIVAGSDLDNDDRICDAGEACGIYPTIDEPLEVVVESGSVTGLNFLSGFRTNLTSNINAGIGLKPEGKKRVKP